MIQVSVVVAVYNGEKTINECLNALLNQNLPRDQYEVIVIDDGSTDGTRAIVEGLAVKLLRQNHRGQQAAQNLGWRTAQGKWIAFTDADAVPSRTWLYFLLQAVKKDEAALGAAGKIVEFPSTAPASRFITLSSGLDTEAHLKHPMLPYAPLGNVMYKREALEEVNGFDERFSGWGGPDLHQRLLQKAGGDFFYEPRAIVLHHHRETWRGLWRQQMYYGDGYAQVMWKYRDRVAWPLRREVGAWFKLIGTALRAAWPIGSADDRLLRKGLIVRDLAQRLGFDRTYYSRSERAKWRPTDRERISGSDH